MRRGTALLPVGNCFFNSRKLNMEQIASIWAPCTVQVMMVDRPNADKPALRFVVGSGLGGYDKQFTAIHDQNDSLLGDYTQINEIHLNQDGSIAFKANDLHVGDKAAVHVYK
jgi:hypothetical protein